MKRPLILGCGGFARELWTWMGEPQSFFFSDFSEKEHIYDMPVLDNPIKYKDSIDSFYLGVSDPKLKESFYNRFSNDLKLGGSINKGNCYTDKNILSDGVVICPGTTITTNIKIKRGVIININCTIGHDTEIEEFSTVSPGSLISGNCNIGRKVYIGTGSSIREKIAIGDNATIGMGSCVVKNVNSNTTVMGVPAKERS